MYRRIDKKINSGKLIPHSLSLSLSLSSSLCKLNLSEFTLSDALPDHILHQIEEEREAERREQERLEWERNHCKVGVTSGCGLQPFAAGLYIQFRLFCRHPVSKERLEKQLEVHKDTSLSDTVALAHKVCTNYTCIDFILTHFSVESLHGPRALCLLGSLVHRPIPIC